MATFEGRQGRSIDDLRRLSFWSSLLPPFTSPVDGDPISSRGREERGQKGNDDFNLRALPSSGGAGRYA